MLRSGPGHPAFNMGLDEALLRSVDGRPTLRLYRWHPHGVSLGYFQTASDLPPIADPHVLVRRITGGGAIFHGDEITFSVTADAVCLPRQIPASYDLIHDAVVAALADVGVRVQRRGADTDASPQARPTQPWCFAATVCEDLLAADGRKILGSAQRRIRDPKERVLHHGSLVLRAPAINPFCGSVADTVDPREVEAELEDALVSRLAAALSLRPQPGEPTDAELADATRLVADRYGCDAFTLRR